MSYEIFDVTPDTCHPGFYIVLTDQSRHMAISTSEGVYCFYHQGFACDCVDAVKKLQEKGGAE